MTFKVTHFDINGNRRCLRVTASSNALAMAWVEQLYGTAMQIRAMKVSA
jgi:hypothetical protein